MWESQGRTLGGRCLMITAIVICGIVVVVGFIVIRIVTFDGGNR
jgi:hypothetical protein